MTALPPNMRETFSTASREWRKNNARPPKPEAAERASDLTQTMRRAFVCECLDTVPLDVAHAQAALGEGEDDHAFLHITRIVLAVKEAARTFNELRTAGRAGSKKGEAP